MENLELQKKLSPINVWALALGCIIGWGAFVMPGNTFLPKAGPLGTAIAMGIAVLGAILSGIVGFYMAASRLLYSMGKEKVLPAFFCKT